MAELPYIIFPSEAEQLIDSIQPQDIEDIGISKEWIAYHHFIEKLNLQAHQSAQNHQDNYVIELFLTYQKFPLLIRNLLSIELWKSQVLPLLTCQSMETVNLRLYFMIYHEATLTNLLEIAFYHEHVIEAMEDDLLIEIIDYIVRKITWIIQLPRIALRETTTFHKSASELMTFFKSMEENTNTEIQRHLMEINYVVAVQCITILRYICERLYLLPLSVVSRLVNKHDIVLSLVVLIENPPWTYKETSGKWKKYIDQKWKYIEPENLLVLTTIEAQIWIAVYYLLGTKSSQEQYEMTTYRKEQILRIRKYINDILVDQLPLLADTQRYLDELSLVDVSRYSRNRGGTSNLVLETVPYLRHSMICKYTKGSSSLTYVQIAKTFDSIAPTMSRMEDLKELADLYQMDGIEDIFDEKCSIKHDEKDAVNCEPEQINDDDYLLPDIVELMFYRDNEKKSSSVGPDNRRPLIEVLDDNENARESEELPWKDIQFAYHVDHSSSKVLGEEPNTYTRYTLLPQDTKKNNYTSTILPNAMWKACIKFKIKNETAAQQKTDEVNLECSDLHLPTASSTSQKYWKQLGSLKDASPAIIQCQFIQEQRTNQYDQAVYYRLGSLYLCIPNN